MQVFNDFRLVNQESNNFRGDNQLKDDDDCFGVKIEEDDVDDCDDDTLFYGYCPNQKLSKLHTEEMALEKDAVSMTSKDNEEAWKDYVNIKVSEGLSTAFVFLRLHVSWLILHGRFQRHGDANL